jgi:hypothetical protein
MKDKILSFWTTLRQHNQIKLLDEDLDFHLVTRLRELENMEWEERRGYQ